MSRQHHCVIRFAAGKNSTGCLPSAKFECNLCAIRPRFKQCPKDGFPSHCGRTGCCALHQNTSCPSHNPWVLSSQPQMSPLSGAVDFPHTFKNSGSDSWREERQRAVHLEQVNSLNFVLILEFHQPVKSSEPLVNYCWRCCRCTPESDTGDA